MKRFSVRYITITGVLIAISVLLASSLCTVYITDSIRISFRNVPIILASLYCGPIAGLIAGLAADLIGTAFSGLGWYPLITISAALIGFLPGIIRKFLLYRCKNRFVIIAICVFSVNVIANMGWTTVCLHWLYGMDFSVMLVTRIPLYIVMATVETYLIFVLMRVLARTYPTAYELMSYEQTLKYIHTINWRGSKLGLTRISELLELLHNPQDKLKFVHVAGTNGKGSTSAMTASILQAQGYKVGLFVSPFVTDFNERMQINGQHISNDELSLLVSRIKPIAESMKVQPTEFELITATAFTYFYQNNCDIVVLEVGLGGELDSTNVISTPQVAVITAIGFDHTKILGDTIEKIASAKAGIVKKDGSVIFYGEDRGAIPVIENACKQMCASYMCPNFNLLTRHNADVFGQSFDYKGYANLWIPLVGSYQVKNCAVVIETVEALRNKGWAISDEAIYLGLHNVSWPARFEVLQNNPLFIVDGGHNPMGVKSTMDTCTTLFGNRKIKMIMGVMADKDVPNMLQYILPKASSVFTVTPDNPRALPASELALLIEKRGVAAHACGSIEAAINDVFADATVDDIILAVGSLYMAGDVRRIVLARNKEN
ncbi:MAG: folate family ECF transporter S component [Eubacteriales bacterium]|nr:folate family ECF transporter S component [Eubacteriales bacterium]